MLSYNELAYWSIIFTCSYIYRYNIFKWCNYNMINCRDRLKLLTIKNNITNIESFIINEKEFYTYSILGNKFVAFDREYININIEEYNKFVNSTKIPNIPDHIISADANIIDNEGNKKTIDILEYIQQLCGPYIDKLTNDNSECIGLYLLEKIDNIDKIINIEVMYTDGEEINLNLISYYNKLDVN